MNPQGGGSMGGGGGGGEGGRIYPGLVPARPAPELPPTTGSPGPGRLQGPAPPLPPRALKHPTPHSPPPTHHVGAHSDTSTLYGPGQSALFGVPFVLNKKYVKSGDSNTDNIPTFSKKSRQQIEDEFYYSFTLEQDIVQRPTTT